MPLDNPQKEYIFSGVHFMWPPETQWFSHLALLVMELNSPALHHAWHET